ncbi:hypothetical protein BRIN106911_03190 [Brevibacillus invocatus]
MIATFSPCLMSIPLRISFSPNLPRTISKKAIKTTCKERTFESLPKATSMPIVNAKVKESKAKAKATTNPNASRREGVSCSKAVLKSK